MVKIVPSNRTSHCHLIRRADKAIFGRKCSAKLTRTITKVYDKQKDLLHTVTVSGLADNLIALTDKINAVFNNGYDQLCVPFNAPLDYVVNHEPIVEYLRSLGHYDITVEKNSYTIKIK